MKFWVLGYFLTAAIAAGVGYVTAGVMAGNKVIELYDRLEAAESRLKDLTDLLHMILTGLEHGTVPQDTIALARQLTNPA